MSQNGTSAISTAVYNLAAAADWLVAAPGNADGTNAITVSGVSATALTSATYNAGTGALVVTGTGFFSKAGGNDIDATKLTITGEGGATYQLTAGSGEVTSPTSFTITLTGADKTSVDGLLHKNGLTSVGATTYNLAGAANWLAVGSLADGTGNGITVSNAAPFIISATYNVGTASLAVTGVNLTAQGGGTNDVTISKLTLTGEGVNYAITSMTNVEIGSETAFSVTLTGADLDAVKRIFNKNGTSSTDGIAYNLAAATDWMPAMTGNADLTGNAITVSNVAVPTITGVTFDVATGILEVTGTGFLSKSGSTNDIDLSKLTFTGQAGGTRTLGTSGLGVEVTSSTSFSVTLTGVDLIQVKSLLDKNGLNSTGGTAYNLNAAEDWAAGAAAGVTTVSATNAITVSNAAPSITSATFDVTTGVLAVTGVNLTANAGTFNDVSLVKLTITGEGVRTLTAATDVEITNATSFSVTLSGADLTAVRMILNKNGTSATGGSSYNIAAAADWMPAMTGNADLAGNIITVSNVAVPIITSATYNASTGVLNATGTGFLSRSGSTNDILLAKLTIAGEGGLTRVLTTSGTGVEITSPTTFSATLTGADLTEINQIINKNGFTSTGTATYNLAAIEDWNTGADAAITTADLTSNAIDASGVAIPTITSASYDPVTGGLAVTGTGFLKLTGAANDIDVSKLTITGQAGGTRQLTTTSVDISNGTTFTVNLNGADKTAVNLLLNQFGTSSVDATVYNLAGAEDWAAGAAAIENVTDITSNGINVSNSVTIVSLNRGVPPGAIVNADVLTYNLTLSGNATGLTSSNFSLTTSGVAGASIGTIGGSGANWTIEVNAGTGSGDITLNIANQTSVTPGITNTLPFAGQTYTIDKTAPTVASVSSGSTNGMFKIGAAISVTVTFSEPVDVTGTPKISLNSGGTATYASGTGTSTLTFSYNVLAGHNAADLDYASTTALILDGGTIKDPYNNNAVLTLAAPGAANSLGNNKNLVIDGTVPTLTPVAIVSNNATNSKAKVNNTITLTFTASETISAPTVTIALQSVTATNTSDDWTATFMMTSGQAEGNIPFSIDFADIATNAGATVTGTTNGSSVSFDKTIPTLSTVAIASNNVSPTKAKAGDIVTLNFISSEPIANPTVKIAGRTETATNSSGNNWTASTTMLGSDANGSVLLEIAFNDLSGNLGTDVTATTNLSSVTLDRTIPNVTNSGYFTANATNKLGDVLPMQVSFSENVFVTGVPTLSVSTGATAIYTAGSGGNTLTFSYTVGAGEISGDLDYAATNSLQLNGGAIKDASGNSADVTLPAPGAANSFTDGRTIKVDGIVPTLTTVTIASNNANTSLAKTGNVVTLNFTASETIMTPVVSIKGHNVTPTNTSGNAWTATYVIIGADADGVIPFNIAFADDAANAGTATATTNSSSVTINRSNTNLSALIVSGVTLSPVFSSGTLSYTGTVPNLTASLTATATLDDITASMTIKAATVTTGVASAPIPLIVGSNLIDVVVTAQNGINTKTYQVTLTRQPSAIADLSAYVISSGVLSPVFNSATIAYADTVANAISTITITPTVSQANATVKIAGTAVASGTASAAIPVSVGENTIETIVTAQDGTTTKTYTTKVIRKGVPTLTLSPASLTLSSIVNIPSSGATSITITGSDITGNTVATVAAPYEVSKNGTTGWSTSVSFTAADFPTNTTSQKVYVRITPTVVGLVTAANVTVTTVNGTTKTAALNGTGVAAVSDNASLALLKSPDYTLSPEFAPGILNYTASVATAVTSIKMVPTVEQANATIKVNNVDVTSASSSQAINLAVGANTVTIIVKAQDQVATKTYTVVITRATPPLATNEVIPDVNGNVTVTETKPEVKIVSPTQPVTVSVPTGTANVAVDYSTLVTTPGTATVPQTTINSTVSKVDIPASTVVTASNPAWDGVIHAPKIDVWTPPVSTDETVTTPGLVIEMGHPTISFSLSKAVRLLLPGQAGMRAAFIHNGVYKEITRIGATDTQAEGDALPTDDAYKINVGADLVIWTKAFSQFITFTQTTDINVAIAASDRDALTADAIKGANSALDNITTSLVNPLPAVGTGGSVITWSSSSTAVVSNNGQTITRPVQGSASPVVTLTATIKKGLITRTKDFTLTVMPLSNQAPDFTAIANRTLCFTTAPQSVTVTGISAGPESGQTTTLSVVSNNPGLLTGLAVNSNTGVITYTPLNTAGGVATITVTATDNGGTVGGGVNTFVRTFTITVNPLPTVQIFNSLGTNDVSKGLTLTLTAAGGSTYSWANAAGIISGQNTATLTIRPAASTTYIVTVTNASGCVSTQSININVVEDYKALDINNLMSPNGDGVNDALVIKNLDMYPNNTVKIFDRAGRVLYQKQNYTNDWAGTFQGSQLAEGTYFYVVDFGAGKTVLKGFVSIVNQQ